MGVWISAQMYEILALVSDVQILVWVSGYWPRYPDTVLVKLSGYGPGVWILDQVCWCLDIRSGVRILVWVSGYKLWCSDTGLSLRILTLISRYWTRCLHNGQGVEILAYPFPCWYLLKYHVYIYCNLWS